MIKHRELAVEAVATFVLVFAVCAVAAGNATLRGSVGTLGVSLAYGFVVVVLLFALGRTGPVHMNPAVTIALAVAGRFPKALAVPYCIAQLGGAVIAAVVLRLIFGDWLESAITAPVDGLVQAFMAEFFIAAILMFVIQSVTEEDGKPAFKASPLAIGMAVAVLSMAATPVSGGSLNPARSLGPALVEVTLTSLPIYLIAPVAGMAAGALGYEKMIGRKPSVQPAGAAAGPPVNPALPPNPYMQPSAQNFGGWFPVGPAMTAPHPPAVAAVAPVAPPKPEADDDGADSLPDKPAAGSTSIVRIERELVGRLVPNEPEPPAQPDMTEALQSDAPTAIRPQPQAVAPVRFYSGQPLPASYAGPVISPDPPAAVPAPVVKPASEEAEAAKPEPKETAKTEKHEEPDLKSYTDIKKAVPQVPAKPVPSTPMIVSIHGGNFPDSTEIHLH